MKTRMHILLTIITTTLFLGAVYLLTHGNYMDGNKENTISGLELSSYVTILITVPETHADAVRKAMGEAGAGKVGNYSFCSFSYKGTGRFMPNEDAHQFIGTANVLETVVEERIETVCAREKLETVIAAIKKVHPYETTIIDIYPVYKIGCK